MSARLSSLGTNMPLFLQLGFSPGKSFPMLQQRVDDRNHLLIKMLDQLLSHISYLLAEAAHFLTHLPAEHVSVIVGKQDSKQNQNQDAKL